MHVFIRNFLLLHLDLDDSGLFSLNSTYQTPTPFPVRNRAPSPEAEEAVPPGARRASVGPPPPFLRPAPALAPVQLRPPVGSLADAVAAGAVLVVVADRDPPVHTRRERVQEPAREPRAVSAVHVAPTADELDVRGMPAARLAVDHLEAHPGALEGEWSFVEGEALCLLCGLSEGAERFTTGV